MTPAGTPTADDLYAVLGVDKTASPKEIREAYQRQAMEHHPDRGGDAELFKLIQRAYAICKDPAKRAEYDSTGVVPGTDPDRDTAEAMVKSAVLALLQVQHVKLEYLDIVKSVSIDMLRKTELCRGVRKALRKTLKKLKANKKRASSGLVLVVFETSIKQLEADLVVSEQDLKILGIVMKLVNECTYEFDTPLLPSSDPVFHARTSYPYGP